MSPIFLYELRRQLKWLDERRLWGKDVQERYDKLKEFLENNAPQQPELFATNIKKEI